MFFLYQLITTPKIKIRPLKVSCNHLDSGVDDRCFASDHCRNIMQFSFAADRFLVEFFSPERLRELDLDPRSARQQGGFKSC